jgi:hypothetical protein
MKKTFTISFILFSYFFSFSQTCTDSLKTVADYDACLGYNSGSGATTNYGTAQQNAAYTIPSNGNRAVLHFDLSSIPSNATITAAYLDLYACYPLGTLPGHTGSNNASLLQRATSPWTELGVTWNTQPSVTTVNQVTLTGTSTYSMDYLGINVTSLIKDIYSAPSNYGFLLRLINETSSNCLSFCSEDHPVPSKHPYLRVYYACSSVGVNELTNTGEFTIMPNPFTDKITLSHPSVSSALEIKVFDSLGQHVYSEKNISGDTTELDFSKITNSKGVYFVIVEGYGYKRCQKVVRL